MISYAKTQLEKVTIEMHCNLRPTDVTPVGQSIHSWLTMFLLLIPYVMLWPWPLILCPWTSVCSIPAVTSSNCNKL